jgi:signal transduction histidine kinase
VLEIADNGIGIPVAEQARRFEPFDRTSKAQAAAIQGTALGGASAVAPRVRG